jgi:hypothetical protein
MVLSLNTLLLAVGLPAAGAAGPAAAAVIHLDFTAPTVDRWFYPFNGSPGTKPDTSIFGPVTDPEVGFDALFDNRDGQMLDGFDTSGLVPPGLDPGSYGIAGARMIVTIKSDLTFAYDPSADPYTSWLPSAHPDFAPDPDAGRPLELFGVGFRCDGYAAASFPENGPFCDGCNCFLSCRGVRCAYPIDFPGACDQPRDVSNNVDDGDELTPSFDPVPFAVAATDSLSPGDPVPTGTELTFEINLDSPCVRGYIADSLSEGMLDFLIASIFLSAQGQEGTFPKIYCKEDPLAEFGVVSAARLEMTVCTGLQGDADGDCAVGVADFLELLATWGPCPDPCPGACPTDFDGDCAVGVNDFLILLANWTP